MNGAWQGGRFAHPPFKGQRGGKWQQSRNSTALACATARAPKCCATSTFACARALSIFSPGRPARARRPYSNCSISRAVINRPELLVADEPTGNVDSEMANRLMGLFTAMNRLGTTVVVATHDVGLINATPGAQLIRLENGTLVDPTGTLRNPPQPPRSTG